MTNESKKLMLKMANKDMVDAQEKLTQAIDYRNDAVILKPVFEKWDKKVKEYELKVKNLNEIIEFCK